MLTQYVIYGQGFSTNMWGLYYGDETHIEIMACFPTEQHMMLPITYAEAALT